MKTILDNGKAFIWNANQQQWVCVEDQPPKKEKLNRDIVRLSRQIENILKDAKLPVHGEDSIIAPVKAVAEYVAKHLYTKGIIK